MAFWSYQALKLRFNKLTCLQLINFVEIDTHRLTTTAKKSLYLSPTSSQRPRIGVAQLYHSCVPKPSSFVSRPKAFAIIPPCYNMRKASDSVDKGNKRTDVTYEELVDLVKSGDVLLIDVREPKEIQQTGLMPGAVNIPITKLKSSLSMTEEKYQQEYKLPKPTGLGEKLIFYGFSNIKSEAALELAHKASFKKARHFPGGWKEWSQKQTEG